MADYTHLTEQERFKLALDSIQEAQSLVATACQALCSVNHAGQGKSAYRLASELHDSTKRHWHRLDALHGRLLARLHPESEVR